MLSNRRIARQNGRSEVIRQVLRQLPPPEVHPRCPILRGQYPRSAYVCLWRGSQKFDRLDFWMLAKDAAEHCGFGWCQGWYFHVSGFAQEDSMQFFHRGQIMRCECPGSWA